MRPSAEGQVSPGVLATDVEDVRLGEVVAGPRVEPEVEVCGVGAQT